MSLERSYPAGLFFEWVDGAFCTITPPIWDRVGAPHAPHRPYQCELPKSDLDQRPDTEQLELF